MGRPVAQIDPIHLRSLAARLSDEEIGDSLGLARVTVTAARKRYGIPSYTQATGMKRRDGLPCHGGRRRHIQFNESFFAELDNELSAYFLGLVAADGSIAKRGNTLEIQLAEPDHLVLERFIDAIDGIGCSLKRRNRADRLKTFYRLALCSKTMAKDLVGWGLTPAKTESMQLERPVPDAHARHFLRGFWDGDGSIGRSHFEVGIRSEVFAHQLRRLIQVVGGEKPPLRQSHTSLGKPFFVMTTASQRFRHFRSELYRDASACMERKRSQFLEHWC